MTRRSSIGFDRRLDLAWLDAAAGLAADGVSPQELRSHLWHLLDGQVAGDKGNSARGKTVTVLNHVWGEGSTRAEALRQRARAHLIDSPAVDRLALHWTMMLATYPLFTDVASAAGRLLVLQGSFSLAHLTRRLVATWGERSTLERAAQRIIRSMVQWGALKDTATRGLYEGKGRRSIPPSYGLLLVEALLVDAEEASIPLAQLLAHPALFPFELDVNSGHIRSAPQFAVHRQGLDTDFVELRFRYTGLKRDRNSMDP